jgi:Right handed beta helix region
MTIKTPNLVIDGKDIRGCIRVQAPGVIIRRSKISCTNFIAVASLHGEYSGTGLLIEDSEISCNSGPGTGISDTNVTALRLNIHGCENGFSIDSSVQISDTYVHDLYTGGGAHSDDIEMEGGSNITVSHNTLLAGGATNSAIITDPTKMSNVTISNNLMAGGTYTLYCPHDSSSNVRVLNNRVSRMFHPQGGQYGPWTDCDKVAQVSGNAWDDTGQSLPF